MENEHYLNDLRDIKQMMSRSTQFLSLSGLAGVFAGTYALIGAWIAHGLLFPQNGSASVPYRDFSDGLFLNIALIAFAVLALSVGTALIFTFSKAKRSEEKVWNSTARRLLVNFLIPLSAGGIFAVVLLRHGNFGLVAPVTLIFYGLACVAASKYTLRDVRYLGLTVVILGLINAEFQRYGLEFWALGFGVCHIVYGAIMYYRYDRNS